MVKGFACTRVVKLTLQPGPCHPRGGRQMVGSAGQRLLDTSDCIDALLGNIATTNWSAAEKEQIRDALGIDGTKTDSTGGVLQKIKNKVNTIFALLFK